MAKPVVMGAQLQCSFGTAPSSLMVVIPLRPMVDNKLVATVSDCIPMANILPFGMCQSTTNPQVISATAAAMGVLTPMPCIPVPAGIWTPGGKAQATGMKILTDKCKLTCAWAGQIKINNPGHSKNVDAK